MHREKSFYLCVILHNFIQLYLHVSIYVSNRTCVREQHGRMLTRFLHDTAGILHIEGVQARGTALPRHRDTQLSLLSLTREIFRPTTGKLVAILKRCLSLWLVCIPSKVACSRCQWRRKRFTDDGTFARGSRTLKIPLSYDEKRCE